MAKEYNYHFGMPIMEIIKSRSSVRTYNPVKLSEEEINKLTKYASDIKGPFKTNVRLKLIDSSEILEKAGGKVGTYGVIKGARDFIAAVAENREKNLEQLGYELEELILYATSLGLGTCWIGGTFNRSDFAKLAGLKDDEILPIVTPVGHPAGKRSVLESFMRLGAKSDQRKPWEDLFFNESFDKPLNENDANEYSKALEAVRLAPSASNKQPWRILKKGKNYHFYMVSNKGNEAVLGFNIQRIDMGIAMCHFEMTLREFGIKGNWRIENPQLNTAETKQLAYIVSWTEAAE